jgi:hypothetical protein
MRTFKEAVMFDTLYDDVFPPRAKLALYSLLNVSTCEPKYISLTQVDSVLKLPSSSLPLQPPSCVDFFVIWLESLTRTR